MELFKTAPREAKQIVLAFVSPTHFLIVELLCHEASVRHEACRLLISLIYMMKPRSNHHYPIFT